MSEKNRSLCWRNKEVRNTEDKIQDNTNIYGNKSENKSSKEMREEQPVKKSQKDNIGKARG